MADFYCVEQVAATILMLVALRSGRSLPDDTDVVPLGRVDPVAGAVVPLVEPLVVPAVEPALVPVVEPPVVALVDPVESLFSTVPTTSIWWLMCFFNSASLIPLISYIGANPIADVELPEPIFTFVSR